MSYFRLLPFVVVPFFLLTAFPAGAGAAGCHCFQQRSYNPEAKSAADPYILASSFNSFLAGAAPVSKRQIIMLKMRKGVQETELIPGLYLAGLLDIPFQEILSLRTFRGKWSEVLEILGTADQEDPVVRLMEKGEDPSLIAAKASEIMISRYFGVKPAEVREYQARGLENREIVLALGLAGLTGNPVADVLDRVEREGASWGEIAASSGLKAEDIGDGIGRLHPDGK